MFATQSLSTQKHSHCVLVGLNNFLFALDHNWLPHESVPILRVNILFLSSDRLFSIPFWKWSKCYDRSDLRVRECQFTPNRDGAVCRIKTNKKQYQRLRKVSQSTVFTWNKRNSWVKRWTEICPEGSLSDYNIFLLCFQPDLAAERVTLMHITKRRLRTATWRDQDDPSRLHRGGDEGEQNHGGTRGEA